MRAASLGAILVLIVAVSAAGESLAERAFAHPRPDGAPKASDVIMRSLRAHPAGQSDPHDTLKALGDFHVTRLEWAYITDPGFISKVHEMGCVFGGAVSAPSYLPANKEDDWFEQVVIVDLEGNPIIAPWKRTWNRTLWGCINNPELERGYVEYLKKCVDAGVDVMQRDEPEANLGATHWGGCFCDHCMAGFRDWLAAHTSPEQRAQLGIDDVAAFDYRTHLRGQSAPVGDAFRKWDGGELKKLFVQFQTDATVAFHERTRAAMNAYAGRAVPMSCNNGGRHWGPVHLGFDWAFGELSYGHATPMTLNLSMGAARKFDRVQVVTMPKSSQWQTLPDFERRARCTIAMAYALGGHCMVPWDTYMPGDTPRYFGTPEQYADLFGFIRATAEFLDGYELTALAGANIEGIGGDVALPVNVPRDSEWYAVVRAVPRQVERPAVIHLVNWADAPAPGTIVLDRERFFSGVSRVTLITPKPYNAEAHAAAFDTGDYAPLVERTSLEVDDAGGVAVPALSPWGLLVVAPS
ncbi:MAG: hypothetical protein JXR94_02595 [Candidatus Hydrogenedentes bacterium]|nr:hypothetical protein [Candidatus Hydrogenedentota bacterium]